MDRSRALRIRKCQASGGGRDARGQQSRGVADRMSGDWVRATRMTGGACSRGPPPLSRQPQACRSSLPRAASAGGADSTAWPPDLEGAVFPLSNPLCGRHRTPAMAKIKRTRTSLRRSTDRSISSMLRPWSVRFRRGISPATRRCPSPSSGRWACGVLLRLRWRPRCRLPAARRVVRWWRKPTPARGPSADA
jgi:hypothetical protein